MNCSLSFFYNFVIGSAEYGIGSAEYGIGIFLPYNIQQQFNSAFLAPFTKQFQSELLSGFGNASSVFKFMIL